MNSTQQPPAPETAKPPDAPARAIAKPAPPALPEKAASHSPRRKKARLALPDPRQTSPGPLNSPSERSANPIVLRQQQVPAAPSPGAQNRSPGSNGHQMAVQQQHLGAAAPKTLKSAPKLIGKLLPSVSPRSPTAELATQLATAAGGLPQLGQLALGEEGESIARTGYSGMAGVPEQQADGPTASWVEEGSRRDMAKAAGVGDSCLPSFEGGLQGQRSHGGTTKARAFRASHGAAGGPAASTVAVAVAGPSSPGEEEGRYADDNDMGGGLEEEPHPIHSSGKERSEPRSQRATANTPALPSKRSTSVEIEGGDGPATDHTPPTFLDVAGRDPRRQPAMKALGFESGDVPAKAGLPKRRSLPGTASEGRSRGKRLRTLLGSLPALVPPATASPSWPEQSLRGPEIMHGSEEPAKAGRGRVGVPMQPGSVTGMLVQQTTDPAA